jgi:hypothetical protein
MSKNVGTIDRTLRIVVGLAIISLVILLHGPVRWIGLIGFVPLLTGFSGWCPAYAVFHISSCRSGMQKHA